MMSPSRILPAFTVLLLTVPLASCGDRDLNAPVLPPAADASAETAMDTTTTARGISTLGSGN